MALPPFLSINGANPAEQNQTLTGDDTNESSVVVSTGGLGTITGFKIKGEGGDDTLTLVGDPAGTNVFGGDGEDILRVGPVGTFPPTPRTFVISDSKFFAGADNDTVFLEGVLMTGTGQGTSQIGTGTGSDQIFLQGDFVNTNLFANDGNDFVAFTGDSSYKSGARAFTGDGDDTLTDGGFEVDLFNTEFGFKGGDDVVDLENSTTGTDENGLEAFLGDGDDEFAGPKSGDVTVLGGSGDDTIDTEDGDDSIEGGDDEDLITSGDGNDTVRGDAGCDTILGQEDEDLLFGDDGSDIIFGGNADDTIDGGRDADLVFGGFGDDVITGGIGVSPEPTIGDVLTDILGQPQSDAEDLSDLVTDGRTGICTIFTENDTLVGGVGNDTIEGESGHDLIFGGTYLGEVGDNVISLIDEVSESHIGKKVDLHKDPPLIDEGCGCDEGSDFNVELEDNFFPPSGDFGIGELTGDDSINGDSGSDVIFGDAGADTIDGGSERDIIMGNTGSDSMTGGQGADIFIQQRFDSSFVLGGSDFTFSPTGLTFDFGTNVGEGLLAVPPFLNAPDIITDFDARDGAGEVEDKLFFQRFEGEDGQGMEVTRRGDSYKPDPEIEFGFVDMTNNPGLSLGQQNWGFNDIVVYSGTYDEATFKFETSANGPDALAFIANGPELFLPGDDFIPGLVPFTFGSQAVVLQGAGDENFDDLNFASYV